MFIDWCAFSIKRSDIIKGVKVDGIHVAVFFKSIFAREALHLHSMQVHVHCIGLRYSSTTTTTTATTTTTTAAATTTDKVEAVYYSI